LSFVKRRGKLGRRVRAVFWARSALVESLGLLFDREFPPGRRAPRGVRVPPGRWPSVPACVRSCGGVGEI